MTNRLLRALAAGCVLLSLGAGVPILLAQFGRSPLDGRGTMWEQVRSLPGQTVTDHVAFGILTITAWLAWGAFTLQVLLEIAAALGAGHWRLRAVSPFEAPVRRLVLAITMAVSMAQRGGTIPTLPAAALGSESAATDVVPQEPLRLVGHAEGITADVAPSLVGHLGPGDRAGPAARLAEPAVPETAPAKQLPQVTVVAGDTPWGLAERHLGNGLRWRELWDLNRGVRQADGRAWVAEDLIHPGWCFQLPADAVGVAPPPAPTSPVVPDDPAQQLPPGESEEPSDTDGSSAPTPTTQAPSSTTTTAPTATTPHPEPEVAGERPAPSESSAPTGLPTEERGRTSQRDIDDGEDADDGLPAPLLGVAGCLLAVGAIRELRRRRARRAVGLPAGAAPPAPIRVPIDRELIESADEVKADRLDAALGHLATSLRPRSGHDCVQPKVVQVRADRIDVLLDRPDPSPPPPWRPEASGLCWVLDGEASLPATDGLTPLPALVSLGTGDSEILLDLEAFGAVALVGDVTACRAAARSMAAELSMKPTGTVTVEVVGRPVEDSCERLDAVGRHRGWDDVDTSVVASSVRLLETGGWPHTWAARCSGLVYDGWAPNVWITETTDHPSYRDCLAAIAGRPGAGSAMLVVGSDPGAGLRVYLDEHGHFEIPELGLSGTSQAVDVEVIDQLADLLDDADAPHDAGVVVFPPVREVDDVSELVGAAEAGGASVTSIGHSTWPTSRDAGGSDDVVGYEDPPFDVLVRVCGEISIEGGSSELAQRETSVAAFVALKGSASIDEIRDAVWSGRDVSTKRVQNVIATIRGSLGDAVTWAPNGKVVAGPRLLTDIELIRRRVAFAERQRDPEQKVEILNRGMELVTGRVCWYPDSRRRLWTWVSLDNWHTYVESMVGSLTSQLGRLYLNAGDGASACRVARDGIDAIGRRDELTILLARGYEQQGDESAVRSVVRAHELYLDELGVEEFNEELLELLDRYAAPGRHNTGG